MSALAQAEEHLRQARRCLEGAVSEVAEVHSWDCRHLAAELSLLRVRIQDLRHDVGDRDPELPPVA